MYDIDTRMPVVDSSVNPNKSTLGIANTPFPCYAHCAYCAYREYL